MTFDLSFSPPSILAGLRVAAEAVRFRPEPGWFDVAAAGSIDDWLVATDHWGLPCIVSQLASGPDLDPVLGDKVVRGIHNWVLLGQHHTARDPARVAAILDGREARCAALRMGLLEGRP